VSDEVVGTIDRERFSITDVGAVPLKGLADPVNLHAVGRRS
jgi:hypothetical protein